MEPGHHHQHRNYLRQRSRHLLSGSVARRGCLHRNHRDATGRRHRRTLVGEDTQGGPPQRYGQQFQGRPPAGAQGARLFDPRSCEGLFPAGYLLGGLGVLDRPQTRRSVRRLVSRLSRIPRGRTLSTEPREQRNLQPILGPGRQPAPTHPLERPAMGFAVDAPRLRRGVHGRCDCCHGHGTGGHTHRISERRRRRDEEAPGTRLRGPERWGLLYQRGGSRGSRVFHHEPPARERARRRVLRVDRGGNNENARGERKIR
mmetsp:Transcript_26806/g.59054  ORF Transcript_26806/g.59054 Transcript_26806/m.59054 type:complete len:258 (-) Transcript_26806:1270-2043(-)